MTHHTSLSGVVYRAPLVLRRCDIAQYIELAVSTLDEDEDSCVSNYQSAQFELRSFTDSKDMIGAKLRKRVT